MSEEKSGGGGSHNVLVGRDLGEWNRNSKEAELDHAKVNGSLVRTRFPPEPNGYLHVGHAKSMNMNFRLAFDKLGVSMENRRTIFRYDDTNPDAESKEYIDSLHRDVSWLGWTPERTTYSSENFDELHRLAIVLIEKGLAYVCDMSKDEMEAQRDLAKRRSTARSLNKDPDVEAPIPSPDVLPGRNRNTSVQRNLQLFDNMRLGMYDEGTYTLRLKMDLESANPNMYDLVAYRIKYTSHPHIGDKWCIYPAYDFTHGICDSLEHIDYSICTLEFETRREPYYWILWALDMYKPKVYEMSRLNVEYTVLSKRRLLKLVESNTVRNWDDPRMPTISGMRRRGYTADIINTFCQDIGATRAMNVVEMDKLQQTARTLLAPTSRRAMVALHPIPITITNLDTTTTTTTFQVQNSPTDESLGSHTITMTPHIYIDASDFSTLEDENYYGLTPQRSTGLKYHGGSIVCDQVIYDQTDTSKVKSLLCHLCDPSAEDYVKPKSYITWVPAKHAIPCEVRLYQHLFTVPVPTDLWEEEINPNSEVICANAMVDDSIAQMDGWDDISKWKSNPSLQLERFGYFVVDIDTTYHPTKQPDGLLVLNETVSLKVDKQKASSAAEDEEKRKRREKQAADAAAKEIRMKILPQNLFKEAPEYKDQFQEYNETTGIPTLYKDGTKVTKSMAKKFAKEQMKHAKALSKLK